jgi:hypothetical protein
MSTSPAPAPTRPAMAVTLVAVVAVTVTAVCSIWSSDRAEGDEPGVVAVTEDFSSPQAAARFATSGKGAWLVKDGAYVLRTGLPSGRVGAATAPLSILRETVSSPTWRMSADVLTKRASGAEFTVVFVHRGRGNYSYVHLDRDVARSGIYRVRRGHTTRLSGLDAVVTAGRAQTVELRRRGHQLKVYLGPVGDSSPAYVGGTRLGGSPSLRAGFGSWGASVRVDNLTVTVPAGSSGPTATPPPGGRAVAVSTSAQLTAALAGALPGDVITLADGVYTSKGVAAALDIGGKHYYGTFVLERSGTAAAPIVVQGTRRAIIDGKPGEIGTGTQYGLYLANADYVQVTGITVTNVTKGVVTDQSSHVLLSGLEVSNTGQEGIHLRTFSTDNVVSGNVVHDTGMKTETYGEGLYVGSANSNWGTYTGGQPDASDRNQLIGNTIYRTGAESMDIKEGTTAGLISGNTFDGAGMSGSWADSWIDLKGNGWVVQNNHGSNALQDGFQVHQALSGWGNNNLFVGNVADVNGPGYGFWLQNGITGTKVMCANTVSGAASGFANAACSSS